MDGERTRLTTFSCERRGGKVYPELDTAEDFPERRVMMMSENEHNTLIHLVTSSTLVSYRLAITTGYR